MLLLELGTIKTDVLHMDSSASTNLIVERVTMDMTFVLTAGCHFHTVVTSLPLKLKATNKQMKIATLSGKHLLETRHVSTIFHSIYIISVIRLSSFVKCVQTYKEMVFFSCNNH
jgi:hypothetical protein